jgi:hypothetical protein
MKLVIGLCGAEGSGKSSVARILVAKHGAVIHPFAGPLKKMLLALGVPPINLYGTPAQKEEPLALLGGKSARFAMQRLGSEWGRDLISKTLWADAWENAASKEDHSAICADDVRFQTEVEAIRNLGGYVVCVRRPDVEPVNREDTHQSAQFWKLPFDYEIINDSNLWKLDLEVDRVLHRIKRDRKKVAYSTENV